MNTRFTIPLLVYLVYSTDLNEGKLVCKRSPKLLTPSVGSGFQCLSSCLLFSSL